MAGLVEQTKNMQVIQKLAGPVPNRMGPTLPSILSGNTHNADNHASPAGNQYVPISQQVQRSPREPPTRDQYSERPCHAAASKVHLYH